MRLARRDAKWSREIRRKAWRPPQFRLSPGKSVTRWPVPFSRLSRSLEAAVGYFELGMAGETLRELDALPPQSQCDLEVLELRAVACQQLGRWVSAAAAYEAMCRLPCADTDRFIGWGCCLYEIGAYADCRLALLSAPAPSRDHGLWNFHLACYEALLGNSGEARGLIHRALKLDPALTRMAERNENLAPLLAGRT